MALVGSSNQEKIWNYLYSKIGNAFGVAGLMGNLYAESALNPKNLQNSYETKLGYTDATYTAAVDNGSYTNFVKDSAGYGLAQWTYWSRKQNLLSYAQSAGASIGDLEMQLGFLYKELSEGYKTVLNTLKNATSVLDASNAALTGYEKPADQSTSVQTKRASYGQKYYELYANSTTASTGTSLAFSVGDTVQFNGTTHYVSASATSGKTCTSGAAKVTAISKSAKHPYHLVTVTGGGSTVYGWVNESDVSAVSNTTTTNEGGNTMAYTNSSLVDCTVKSPNHSGTRTHAIDRITPHCVVGQLSAESIGGCFTSTSRQASCNYGIGKDGRVCLVVDEANRSWCSSSNANDQRAITIECASDTTSPYTMNDAVYNKLVKLCIDICKRNGLTKVLWMSDKGTSLAYTPKSGECVLTVHRWFANKSCPGDWLYNRMSQLAADINVGLSGTTTTTPSTGSNTTTSFKVGDVVKFTGTTHYVSASATSGSTCKSGTAKVTAISNGAKHPYHLIAESGGGSNVYGWVNAADISAISTSGGTSSGSIKKVTASNAAKSFLKSLAGTYTVKTALNCRDGAGTSYKSLVVIPKGTSVKNYGYYTTVSGVKWLYIQFTLNGTVYTGFSSSAYLAKA